MHNELEILESAIKPVQLAWAFGLPLEVDNQSHFCGLESPRQFRVTEHGFISSTPGDMFQSGTCMDFAAYRVCYRHGIRGREAYVQGARDILMTVQGRGVLKPEQAESIGHAAWLRRRIFDFVRERSISARQQVSQRNITAVTLLRGLGIDRDLVPGTVALFEGDDWSNFRRLCDAAGLRLPAINFTNGRLMVPFYSDPGTIACLEMHGRRTDHRHEATVQIVPLYPARMAFSGLPSHIPGEPVLIHKSSLKAAAMTSSLRLDRGRGSCMAVQTDMSAGHVGWKPEEVVFMEGSAGLVTSEPAVLDLEGVEVWTSDAEDVRMACEYRYLWRDQLVERIVRHLEAHGMDPDARLMITPCRHSLPLRFQLLRAAVGLDEKTREQLEGLLQDGLLISNRSVKIFGTVSGYRYCLPAKGEDGPLHELSNFTLELVASVMFPEEANFFHQAVIRTREGEFDMILQSEDLESARKLDKAVKQGCMVAGFGEEHDTPVITDLLTARHLIPFWRSATAKLPREQGMAFLGWDGVKKSYHGPGFVISGPNKIAEGVRSKHPSVEILKFFDGSQVADPLMHTGLPADLADIISQAIAMCARSHTGHAVHPVMILNTGDAPRVLRALFGAIGQSGPIELNSNQRVRELPGLRGWPAWAMGYTAAQVSASSMPLFMLGDRGFRLTEGHSDDVLVAAGEALAWLLQKCAEHMLKSGDFFRRQHGVLYESELAREGAHMICQLAGVPEWPISQTQYELLEKVLRDIPPAEVGQWFEHDLRNQTVAFNHRKLPRKIDRRDLLLQFSPLVKMIEDRDGQFVMDAVSAVSLLDNFYQGDGVPAPVNLPMLQAVEN